MFVYVQSLCMHMYMYTHIQHAHIQYAQVYNMYVSVCNNVHSIFFLVHVPHYYCRIITMYQTIMKE